MAPSTIENSGFGVFAGVPFAEGNIFGYGDFAIPIIDLDFHAAGSRTNEDYHWLLDEYTWSAALIGANMYHEADQISAFVNGIGSLPNCHFRLENVEEKVVQFDTAGCTRRDPCAGAYTPYHNRSAYISRALDAGQEVFISYGSNYFTSRESYMGLTPLSSSFPIATKFIESFRLMVLQVTEYNKISHESSSSSSSLDDAMSDLWTFIIDFEYRSRPLSALPRRFQVAKRAMEVGVEQTEVEESTRSLNYLVKHGKCLDNIRPDTSTIQHAGRGAFATRSIPKGDYVSIAPLIHIPERDVLNVYASKYDPETGEEIGRDFTKHTGYQLLLNYCFGHASSTMLLCPYGPGTVFINHDSKSPNVKLEWSIDPYHNASWLKQPVSYFDNVWRAGLAFEYIALRDIDVGEEITFDYGIEWENAWREHERQWVPPNDASIYMLHHKLNQDLSLPVPTHDEDAALISDNIEVWCNVGNGGIWPPPRKPTDCDRWELCYANNSGQEMKHGEYTVLRVIARSSTTTNSSSSSSSSTIDGTTTEDNANFVYTTVLLTTSYDGKPMELYVENVPRKALSFYHVQPYQSDMFIPGAFRHEIMIPDRLFPEAWKNLI